MKKFILSALFVLTSAVTMNAFGILGIFNVGARIGMISSSEQIPMNGDQIKESINAEGTGWTGTVFARINFFDNFYLQPELQYTNTQIDLPSLDDLIGKEEEQVESRRYIDLPLLVGVQFGLGDLACIRINAGPVFAITEEKGFKDLVEEDFIAAYKNPSVTWTAGIGATVLGGIVADFRYNGNFKNGEINTEDVAGSIDTNRTSWTLSIGIMF